MKLTTNMRAQTMLLPQPVNQSLEGGGVLFSSHCVFWWRWEWQYGALYKQPDCRPRNGDNFLRPWKMPQYILNCYCSVGQYPSQVVEPDEKPSLWVSSRKKGKALDSTSYQKSFCIKFFTNPSAAKNKR